MTQPAELHTCSDCERCTFAPGPGCEQSDCEKCPRCGHCQVRHGW